jgi:hypothetical protein
MVWLLRHVLGRKGMYALPAKTSVTNLVAVNGTRLDHDIAVRPATCALVPGSIATWIDTLSVGLAEITLHVLQSTIS